MGTALLLLAAQVPFLLTGHVQEDAYITLRCAVNLAATGVYGFNPGEAVSASTSHLAVLLAAAARLLAGERYLLLLQLLYGCFAVTAAYVVATSVTDTVRERDLAWAFIALTPVALLIGYSGMETGTLLLATAVLIRALATGRCAAAACIAGAALPWIRPDAIGLGLAVVSAAALMRAWRPRQTVFLLAIILGSTVAWLLFNHAYFGTYLTQTIVAKALLWSPRSVGDGFTSGAARVWQLLVGDSQDPGMFVPIRTRYLAWTGPAATLLTAFCAVSLWRRTPKTHRAPIFALALITFGLPIAYAAGGRVYPWYTWLSAWTGMVLIVTAVVTWPEHAWPSLRTFVRRTGLTLIPVGVLGQFVFAVSWGTQESLYRGGIGTWLSEMAAPGDTLLLEPAGYIPYFSRLRTEDEIGLASPRVVAYRRRFGSRWWFEFVRDVQPTFIVEREPMTRYTTLDGYELSSDERTWFVDHYTVLREFTYDPAQLRTNPLAREIARFGSAGSYLVYRRRELNRD